MNERDVLLRDVSRKLFSAQDGIRHERIQWEQREAALRDELEEANDLRYLELRRNSDLVAAMVETSRERESELRNYIEAIETDKAAIENKHTQALLDLNDAKGKSLREHRLSQQRMRKWHEE